MWLPLSLGEGTTEHCEIPMCPQLGTNYLHFPSRNWHLFYLWEKICPKNSLKLVEGTPLEMLFSCYVQEVLVIKDNTCLGKAAQ